MIKLGIDLHGVIDKDPDFFSELSYKLIREGHEVYIITGREMCEDLKKELDDCNMHYTNILSITTYQKNIGTPISYLDGRKSQPMMEPKIWNPTKAVLCASANIDIMVDDSTIYEEYFRDIKTQYIVYNESMMLFLKNLFYI